MFQSIVLWQVSLYAFPVIVYTVYKRGYFSTEGQILLLKLGAVGVLTLFAAFVLRAFGRATNTTYLRFNEKYRSIIANYNHNAKVSVVCTLYFFLVSGISISRNCVDLISLQVDMTMATLLSVYSLIGSNDVGEFDRTIQ